uniref:Gag-pol polyprotein n=1 Tax=Cannabis sativa TaxID=3483 RepID=A0A803P4I0_CANSA
MASMGAMGQPNAQRGEEGLPQMTITLTEMMRWLRGLIETKWPPKMATDPGKRDKGRYCAFNGEHGHATCECRKLKIEVNRLTVNVISGGSDLSGNSIRASMAHTRRIQLVRAMAVIDNDGPDVLLSFNQWEASELEHPHDDALVITLDVAHIRMKCMLVDNGSSANILFAGVLKEMEIEDLKAQDTQVTLVGFSRESVVAQSFV